MKSIHLIAGLPRSGSTLLCNLLNMNPNFYATETSPVVDLLAGNINMYSHNMAFKVTDRTKTYDRFADALNSLLNSYFNIEGKEVIFDKSRGWTRWLLQLDDIRDNEDTKILFTYRNPKDIIKSIENKHRSYPLLEFPDTPQANGMLQTFSGRINTWIADNGIVYNPSVNLQALVEMGYEDRIMIVDYKQLCSMPQETLNKIHEFLGIDVYNYSKKDFKDLKQTTFEYDTFYNEKFPHTIKEGSVKYVEHDTISLPSEYEKTIDQRFTWLNNYVDEKTRMKPIRAKRNK